MHDYAHNSSGSSMCRVLCTPIMRKELLRGCRYVLHPNKVKPSRLKTILPGMYAEAPSLSGAEGSRARPPRTTPLWQTHPPPRVPARGEYVEIRNCKNPTVSEAQMRSYNQFTTALDSRHTDRWVDTLSQVRVSPPRGLWVFAFVFSTEPASHRGAPCVGHGGTHSRKGFWSIISAKDPLKFGISCRGACVRSNGAMLNTYVTPE